MGFNKRDNQPATSGGYGVVSVGTSAAQIVGANKNRLSILIQNQGTTKLYIGFDNSVASNNYAAVLKACSSAADGSSGVWMDGGMSDVYEGAVWGIRASGTSDASYSEITQ